MLLISYVPCREPTSITASALGMTCCYPGAMSSTRRVYSTDHGRMCPQCDRLIAACRCKKTTQEPKSDGIVRVSRSTKGRKGKGVTLISGVPLGGEELKTFAKQLKAATGAGGAIKEGVIEIQGDHRDKLIPVLEAKGWTVKRAGG